MKKEKKKYTQSELNMAVREARRSGVREGRDYQRRNQERQKQFKKFHDECEQTLKESVEAITTMVRRSHVPWTQGDILKRAAVRALWQTRIRLGEKL